MASPGHDCDLEAIQLPDHQFSGMADGRRCGPLGNFGVGNGGAIAQLVGECSEAAAQHHGDTRGCPGPGTNVLDRGGHYSSMPAMQADIKFAIVPAATALNPSRARSGLRLGASAPIPPIWIAMELKFANPHSA